MSEQQQQLEASHQQRLMAAEAIVDSLPEPDYKANYQVPYDRAELVGALVENLDTPGVAKPVEIDSLRGRLAAIGEGSSRQPLVITNSCAEDIRIGRPIERLGDNTLVELAAIGSSAVAHAIKVQRIGGQFVKPRTEEFEGLPDGSKVQSYKGDGINDRRTDRRDPDPSRLVGGAAQSRSLQEYLTLQTGDPVLMAHEALSLAYERPFIRQDPENGKQYLLSAHLPWIGKRTNAPTSVQAELLTGVENAIGVKIGANSDEEHIAQLAETLNPDGLPGKIVFMLRLGAQDASRYPIILRGIKQHAEGSLVLYDLHGETRVNEHGEKIRAVGDIEQGIARLAGACDDAGLRLHGIHLETGADYRQLECIDERHQRPSQRGNVDPRLNPRQTRQVLNFAAPYIS